jgi:hypothetical protein
MELEIRTDTGILVGTYKNRSAVVQFEQMLEDKTNFEFKPKIIKSVSVPAFIVKNDVYLTILGDIEIYVKTNYYIKVL